MSTFDPGFDPPGDWQSPYAPTPPQGPSPITRRAALYVWFCAGMGLMMSGCCVLNTLGMVIQPDLVLDQMPTELPPELQNIDMKPVVRGTSVVIGVMAVLLVFLPAILLAVLGFSVRQGKPGSVSVARGLVWLYIVLSSAGLILTLVTVASHGQFLPILLPVLLLGGWLFLCTSAITSLNAARQSSIDTHATAPWGY